MKITRLRIINFLGIKEFVADKLGKVNAITGDNGVGKTAILKAIQEGFRSSGVDPELIRIGTDKAEVMVEIDGRIMSEKVITSTDNKVKVTEDGITKTSPAKFLAALLGPFIFNPVDFFLAKPKERRTMLLSAIEFKLTRGDIENTLNGDGELIQWDELNFDKHGLEVLEMLQTQIYNKRHLQNQNATRLQKALEQDKRDIPETFDTDKFKDFDFKMKHAEFVEANKEISDNASKEISLHHLRTDAVLVSDSIKEKQEQMAELQSAIEKNEQKLLDINKRGKALALEVKSFEPSDIEAMEASIEAFNDSQELIAKIKEITRRTEEHNKVKADHERLENLHKVLMTTVPQQLLAKMDLPIEGISITGNQIKCDDIAIDKMATSEQMEFSMDIARALAGDLKVICVDRLESLSKVNRQNFRMAALKSDDIYQYFTTEVTDGSLAMESTDTTEKKGSDKAKKNTAKKESKQSKIDF